MRALKRRSLWFQALVTLALAALLYLPMLGAAGFAHSEGHRVIPGWTMAETGRWGRMEMFGVPYLTKPPGLPALIGAASLALGESEFAARLVSALCMAAGALVTLLFARRWFGPRWALPAALAHVLMPWFWAPARSAEIESLHVLGTQATCFCILTLLLAPPRARRTAGLILTGAGACTVMFLAKGPAGLPCVAGALAAAAITQRSPRMLVNWRAWLTLALGSGGAFLALRPWFAQHAAEQAVTDSVARFLWHIGDWPGIALLLPGAFVAALPASLALVLPWGPDARLEASIAMDASAARAHTFARALALVAVLSAGLYLLFGVSNHRYVMPAAAFLPALVAYAFRGVEVTPDGFLPLRRRIARTMMLGAPRNWLFALLIGAAVWIPISEATRARHSGRAAGEALAAALPDGATVHASALIDAVPETLLYARRAALRDGRHATIVWDRRAIPAGELPTDDRILILRHDGAIDERLLYADAIATGDLAPIHTGAVRHYNFTAYARTVPGD